MLVGEFDQLLTAKLLAASPHAGGVGDERCCDGERVQQPPGHGERPMLHDTGGEDADAERHRDAKPSSRERRFARGPQVFVARQREPQFHGRRWRRVR